MVLKADSREPDNIFNILSKENVAYERDTLPIGDFVDNEICFERKAITDFVSSIRTGHLQEQLLKMQDNFDKCFLLISGHSKDLWTNPYMKGWSVNHHLGSLASIAARYPKVKMVQVDNDTQLISIIPRIIEKCRDGKIMTKYDTEFMTFKMTGEDIKTKMLTAIPNVGFNKAKNVAEKVDILIVKKGTTERVDEKYLRQIDGIGQVIAENISNAFKGDSVKKEEMNSGKNE